MRQAIETAPRDSTSVILEDDASGTYDVAHWSAEVGRWVGENGEPSKIAPTHWHQRPRDQYFPQEDERQRRFAVFPIVVVGFLVMGLMGLYFEVFDSLYLEVFHSETSLPKQDSPKTDLARRQWAEADHARIKKGTQVKQAVEAPPREARQPVMTGPLTESSLANEFAENRHAIGGLDRQLQAGVANFAQSVEQDQQRITILLREATELTASTEQHHPALEEERARNGAPGSEFAAGHREIEAQAAQSLKSNDEAQLKQAEAAMSAQAIEEERNSAAALALEAAAARRELAASAEQHRLALEEERARSAALASELATAQREIENRAAQSQKAVDAAVQQRQAAEVATAELRQSLQQEQEKTAALMQQAKAAQAMASSVEPQRRALEEAQARAAALASELAGTQREIETRAARSQKALDEAVREKQAMERIIAELRQSLLHERDRTEAMARATAQRPTAGRVTVGRSDVVQVTQATKTAAMEAPNAVEAKGKAEAAKLIARASALLGQGNIGAARIVLERAAESGHAQASFMLAETYDPVILSAWGTYGTRGEAAKAREHYAKAHAGGIREAKDRLDALRQ